MSFDFVGDSGAYTLKLDWNGQSSLPVVKLPHLTFGVG